MDNRKFKHFTERQKPFGIVREGGLSPPMIYQI